MIFFKKVTPPVLASPQKITLSDVHLNVLDIGTNSPNLPVDIKISRQNINKIQFGADTDLPESPSDKFPLLLGSKESEATLYVTRQELCSSIYKPQIPGRFDQHSLRYDVLKEVKVNVTTLDSLIEKEHSLEKIHLIRIVTQGSEYEILQGAIKTCDKYQPLIFVHTWLNSIYHESGNLEQILGWARLNGYVAIDLKPAVTWLPKGTEINQSKREVIGVSVLLCRKNIFEDNYEDNRLQTHSSIEHISYILSNYGFTALASFLVGKNDRTASDKRMALNLALFLNSPSLLKKITHFLKRFLSLK